MTYSTNLLQEDLDLKRIKMQYALCVHHRARKEENWEMLGKLNKEISGLMWEISELMSSIRILEGQSLMEIETRAKWN